MPYKNRKRKMKKRRSYRRNKSLASRAMKVAVSARKLAQADWQRNDMSATSVQGYADSVVHIPLNTMLRGTAEDDRHGDMIRARSIHIRMFVRPEADTVGSGFQERRGRIILWRQKDIFGATPSLTDLLLDTSQFALAESPYNYQNKGNFQVYWDKRYIFANNSNSLTYHTENIYKKVGFKTRYFNTSNTGTISDISQNALILSVFSDGLAASNSGIQISYHATFKYFP